MIPVRVVLLAPPLPPLLPPTHTLLPSPPSRWKVGGGCRGRGGGGGGGLGRGLQASRDTCFLLSGPKWNPDKNTPLVAACLWVAATGDSKSSFVRIINVTESYRKVRVGMARFGISKKSCFGSTGYAKKSSF